MATSWRSITALAAILLAAPLAGQQRPDLSGWWVLKADPPAPADSADAPPDSAGAAGDSVVTGGPGSDLHPVVRRGRRPEEQQQLSRLVGMAQPVAAFRITHADSLVSFRNEDGFTYAVRPGAEWDSIQVGEDYVRLRGRWREQALEVEFRPPGGGKILETYHLADSRTFLRLEVVIEHNALARRLWRARMYRLEPE